MTKQDLIDIIKEEIENILLERCQKGYKTHPTRKTKKMYGKTYRNCIKAEEASEESDTDEVLDEKKSESLYNWFKDNDGDGQKGWEQIGGKYQGKPCAKQPGQKTKPKCVSPERAAKMTQAEKDSAARRKRKKDGNPNRRGKPINVKTDSKRKSKKRKSKKS